MTISDLRVGDRVYHRPTERQVTVSSVSKPDKNDYVEICYRETDMTTYCHKDLPVRVESGVRHI
jgi:hypothetical protein